MLLLFYYFGKEVAFDFPLLSNQIKSLFFLVIFGYLLSHIWRTHMEQLLNVSAYYRNLLDLQLQ